MAAQAQMASRARSWLPLLSYGLGLLVIVLAALTAVTELSVERLMAEIRAIFGISFVLLYLGLSAIALTAAWQLFHNRRPAFFAELGGHAATGLSTLALTYTLLGISLGIGSLSGQTLAPDTISDIISDLTRHFSTAFMTTVVGLPTVWVLRTLIGMAEIRRREKFDSRALTYQESER